MPTPEGFRSLAETLRARDDATISAEIAVEEPREPRRCEIDEVAAAREVRIFRAQLNEAMESAIETLRNDIAADVVGRELYLCPADMQAIVQRLLQCYAAEAPVRVRVHPDDADSLSPEVCVVSDRALRRGDAILEVQSGTIDASLGVRLDSVLRAFQ